MLIEAEKISKRFGGLTAVDSVTVRVRSGEVTSVIGPNGAGKTTLINCLSGVFPFDSGEVRLDGVAYRRLAARDLVEIGVTRTFQNLRLWEHLTVEEHVVLARRNYIRSRRAKRSEPQHPPEPVEQLLARVELQGKAKTRPRELSYGERRRLEVARALATAPRLLLLDEPAAGFNLSEQSRMAQLIREIAVGGIAIILVEHHMDLVAEVSSHVVVMNFGRELASGSIGEIRSNPAVISAYLGTAG
jgi:branched-chain amino acid transport system ATP-binding protein